MSKVYDNHLEMEELNNDNEYQEFLLQQEAEAQSEAYGMDNMEPNKAEEFARKLMEIAS